MASVFQSGGRRGDPAESSGEGACRERGRGRRGLPMLLAGSGVTLEPAVPALAAGGNKTPARPAPGRDPRASGVIVAATGSHRLF